MRIGVDAHLVKSQPTGVGKAIIRTIEAMAQTGPEDEFIIYANREFPADLDHLANCRVIRTPLIARSRVLRVLHEQVRMPQLVRRDHIDAFYAPGYVFPGDLRVPMALEIFDLNALKYPHLVKPATARYYAAAMPASARRAALIIAPTRAVSLDIETVLRVPPARIRIVPLAVDDRFRSVPGDTKAVSERYGIGAPYVLFVGNIEPNKNLRRLVEAFFAAKMNRGLPHRLVLAGKPRHRAAALVRFIRRLACEDSVVFTGYVPDADLPALYAGADVFVYPSHAEGFGLPPLEAMMMGTPVITSQDAAVVEVTGDGAVHVPAEDLAALREAIETMLVERGQAAALARRGREIASRFSWADTGRRTLAVIHETLDPDV